MTSYTPDFYAKISDSASRSAEVVLPLVFDALGRPASVLDVGCGTAGWLAVASSLGVEDVLGVDGDYLPREQLRIPADRFSPNDLTRPLDIGRRFDLVMTLEVAEHIAVEHAATFVASLCRHADVVLFSAAFPGQGGNSHVNEQPPSYWAGLFSAQGFELFDVLRPTLWDDDRVMYYYRQNVLLFARGDAARRLREVEPRPLIDVVHPGTLDYWRMCGVVEGLKLTRSALVRAVGRRAAQVMTKRRSHSGAAERLGS